MLCLSWHMVMPCWHCYHTPLSTAYITKDYAKNKIFMTFCRLLISKMVVLHIIVANMFILRGHYPVLAQLQSKFQEGQATLENVKLTTVRGYCKFCLLVKFRSYF